MIKILQPGKRKKPIDFTQTHLTRSETLQPHNLQPTMQDATNNPMITIHIHDASQTPDLTFEVSKDQWAGASDSYKAAITNGFKEVSLDDFHHDLPTPYSRDSIDAFVDLVSEPDKESTMSWPIMCQVLRLAFFFECSGMIQTLRGMIMEKYSSTHFEQNLNQWSSEDVVAIYSIHCEHPDVLNIEQVWNDGNNNCNVDQWFGDLDLRFTQPSFVLSAMDRLRLMQVICESLIDNPEWQEDLMVPLSRVYPMLVDEGESCSPPTNVFREATSVSGIQNLASPEQFRQRWDQLTFGLFEHFDWTGIVAAGGMVHFALDLTIDIDDVQPMLFRSDVDLWIRDKQTLVSIYQQFQARFPGAMINVNELVATIVIPGIRRNIQIIYSAKQNFAATPLHFDVDYAKAFYDGDQVYASADCIMSIITRYLCCRHLMSMRACKAIERGFGFLHQAFTGDVSTLFDEPKVKRKLSKYYYPDDVYETDNMAMIMRRMFEGQLTTSDADVLQEWIADIDYEDIKDTFLSVYSTMEDTPISVSLRNLLDLSKNMDAIVVGWKRKFPSIYFRESFKHVVPFRFQTQLCGAELYPRNRLVLYIPESDPVVPLLNEFSNKTSSEVKLTSLVRKIPAFLDQSCRWRSMNVSFSAQSCLLVNGRTRETMNVSEFSHPGSIIPGSFNPYTVKVTVMCLMANRRGDSSYYPSPEATCIEVYPASWCKNSMKKRKRL